MPVIPEHPEGIVPCSLACVQPLKVIAESKYYYRTISSKRKKRGGGNAFPSKN
jgi:hypothetical protein